MGVNRLEFQVVCDEHTDNVDVVEYNKKHWIDVLKILLLNDYEIKIIYDGLCVLIEFELCPEVYGGPRLKWVDKDE